MNRIHLVRAIVFGCLLLFIGGVIYYFYASLDKEKAERQRAAIAATNELIRVAAERERAAAATSNELRRAQSLAAAERERFLGYVNTNIVRNPGEEMIAVVCASETGSMNAAVGNALASHFKRDHVKFVSSFFRPTVIADGSFDALFTGSKAAFKKIALEKSLDGLLLAKQDVQYAKNDALDGVITADMHVQIVTLPVTGQIESQSWTLAAKGTGFNNADARMQAEERIINQINANTNMALIQFTANN